MNFLLQLGLRPDHLRFRDHAKEELAFYSKATSDIEYLLPLDGVSSGELLTVQIMI